MKLPNGYGSVYKLSGRRRNPWCARKTVGWKDDAENKRSAPVYQFIGYYPTKQLALQALADYNADPYDLHIETMTLEELYEKWSERYFDKRSQSYVRVAKAAWKVCEPLKKMRLVDLKLDHFQKTIDECQKNAPTLKMVKIIIGLMYDYAVQHEILPSDKRNMIRYIDISQAGNPNALNRKPFSKAELKSLWDAKDNDAYVSVILILAYTGLRIGELLDLEKKDVHLDERWLFIKESKTEAGIREVPIAEKIAPFFECWLSKSCDHLICAPDNKPFDYQNYYCAHWMPIMEQLNMKHTPHDTRHTCISLLTEAGVDKRIIQKIVGHKGQTITEAVYTHLDLPVKLEAINKI